MPHGMAEKGIAMQRIQTHKEQLHTKANVPEKDLLL